MLKFIIGTMVGGLFGVVSMCLCVAAGEADRQLEANIDK